MISNITAYKRKARRRARGMQSNCAVVFFDEIDACECPASLLHTAIATLLQ